MPCRDNPQAFGKAGLEFKAISTELVWKKQDSVWREEQILPR